jgi:hypothetical protein
MPADAHRAAVGSLALSAQDSPNLTQVEGLSGSGSAICRLRVVSHYSPDLRCMRERCFEMGWGKKESKGVGITKEWTPSVM